MDNPETLATFGYMLDIPDFQNKTNHVLKTTVHYYFIYRQANVILNDYKYQIQKESPSIFSSF